MTHTSTNTTNSTMEIKWQAAYMCAHINGNKRRYTLHVEAEYIELDIDGRRIIIIVCPLSFT